MASPKAWISAMRLRTLPLAASCVLVGSAMGWSRSWSAGLVFTLALITTILLQVLSNLANDYGDYSHGVDNAERVGPERAMQSGAITAAGMKRALIIVASLAFLCGLALLWFSLGAAGLFWQALVFLLAGLLAIVAAFKYTVGKNPYGYRGLGDIAVFVFFGLVGVTGTCFLHTHSFEWNTLLPATAVGLMSCAVLNLNNMRDHVNDAASGKITIVVKMGFDNAKYYHLFLIIAAWFCAFLWAFRFFESRWQMLCMVPVMIQFLHLGKVIRTAEPAELDPQLKVVALSTFLYALLFFVAMVLYS